MNSKELALPQIDEYTEYVFIFSAKQLIAAWRVLVGVWAPKRWDLNMSALQQYLVPPTPPENPWIDKAKKKSPSSPSSTASASDSPSPSPAPPSPPASPQTKRTKAKRAPTRKLIRHVLRARFEAVRALSTFFHQLEAAAAASPGKRVYASAHLAHQFGGVENPTADGSEAQGFRHAREVLTFLRERGAKITTLASEIEGDYWASRALSDGEGDTDYMSDGASVEKEPEDLVWIAPAIQKHD